MDTELFSSILGAVYDTPTSFESWRSVLDLLKQAFDCHIVTLIEKDVRGGQSRFAEIGIGASVAQEYFKNWHDRNIFYGKALNWKPGAAQREQEVVPRSILLRSDYYNGFLRRYEMRGFIGMTIANDNVQRSGISLLRPPTRDDFEEGVVKWAGALMPHLQNAARITRRLSEANIDAEASFSLLELNPVGILLLNRSGAIVFANRAVRAMANKVDGLALRRSSIEAEWASENAQLQTLIAGALGAPPSPGRHRGGAVQVSRASGARGYVVTVGSLPPSSKYFGGAGSVAFVLVSDPQTTASTSGILRQIYKLTATEARLAECLARGESLDKAAESLLMKTSTAKWHLHALFQKTDVTRQSELVHLLSSLPWAGGRDNGQPGWEERTSGNQRAKKMERPR